jgi:hypothetical protein
MPDFLEDIDVFDTVLPDLHGGGARRESSGALERSGV